MKRCTLLEHTTDIRIKLEASSFQDLFIIALEGMNGLIKKKILHSGEVIQAEIKITSPDATALLIDFLSEVLTLSHIKKTVFNAIFFTKLTDTTLCATISGEKIGAFDEDIKAVTYHEAYVKKNENDSYEAFVIFDI